jgi:DNA-binding NtrC family response regulator
VLEDDLQVAGGMVSLLQSLGAEVQHFPDAEEALRHRGIAEADYYIVDYSLGGGMTGYQFLEELQHRRHTLMRAVILTGETSSQFVRTVEDSPWPVLHKPANLARLAACLNISY